MAFKINPEEKKLNLTMNQHSSQISLQIESQLQQLKSQINTRLEEVNCQLQQLKALREAQTPGKKLADSIYSSTITDICMTSSMHALPQIIRTKRTSLKIIWILLLTVSCCACSYYVFDSISEYLQHKIVSQTISITELTPDFPTVSICNYNDMIFKLEILSFYFNSADLLKDWKNHFEMYNDTRYGQCYRFNSGKNYTGHFIPIKNSTSPGYYYGLDLRLFVETKHDYSRLKLFIHNHTVLPAGLDNKGIFIISGGVNYFSAEKFFNKILAEPFNDCYDDVATFAYNKTLIDFIQARRKYSQDECIKLCQNLLYQEKANCKCKISSLEANLIKDCIKRNTVQDSCTSEYMELFSKKYVDSLCPMYCPMECKTTRLIITQFNEIIPAKGRISPNDVFNYPQFQTYENVSRSFFSIYVYYENFQFTLRSQLPKMQAFDLFSSLGGIIGLFLGMGLLSFVEIFEIIFEIISAFLRNLFQR